MSSWPYTDEELNQYFANPVVRRRGRLNGDGSGSPHKNPPQKGFRGYLYRRFGDPMKVQAAFVLSILTGAILLVVLFTAIFLFAVSDDMPSFEQLDNPSFQLATVAYTADGKELARYAWQNRSWANFDEISPHAINALIATEDRRFYKHWGIDFQGILSAALDVITEFDLRGASTISQQLARNLYNEQIGREVTISRKLKEMVTAIQLERRYTKPEIIEMYLNTVEFGNNAFGIDAAARTFFGKEAKDLDVLESATLIGMLKAVTYYNPVRNPENAKRRRNVVLQQMAKRGYITDAFLQEHINDPVVTDFNPSEITESFAPYFSEYVRHLLTAWGKANGHDIYAEGLVVYTTLDSRLQQYAREAVDRQMEGLQAVVDFEWSRQSGISLGSETAPYVARTDYEPFKYFWESKRDLVDAFIRESEHFRNLREAGLSASEALNQLRNNQAFMDSLKAEKTRLEAGLVAIDPHNGQVKAWVGGRSLKVDWYDHVAIAKRQPGSTFKPFVYTAAIDNGYSPNTMLPDSTFTWRDPSTGQVWRPGNFGGSSGRMLTLRQALATSNNLITARVITQLVNPETVAFYARRMGIKSELDPVPALGLGTSDVTLLELTSAYATLANGGLYYDATVVTRIEDRYGNVLYEAVPAPQEALNEETAYTIVDMMRGVIDYGTGQRINWQFGLGDYDLAAKTGTTQNAADGWFVMMHPNLVTGAWVGFNDRRIAFRTEFWGQGAHNALYLVGDFFKAAASAPASEGINISKERFPMPEEFSLPQQDTYPPERGPVEYERERTSPRQDRVGW